MSKSAEIGIDHLTVVPVNFEQPDTDDDEESDDVTQSGRD